MCGIFGYYGLNDKQLLLRMGKRLEHRGNNDKGIFMYNLVGLGSQRLSIIDLKKGKQPIHNEDESIWITYNGEIYNFSELKIELEKKGHRFYTETDTEVIVHAYEEYGTSCLKKFNGMFAFALWDSKKKELFVARDRLGIKPLYYYLKNSIFLFASELKALLEYDLPRKINLSSLSNYLTFRYTFDQTLIDGVSKLKPGTFIIISKNGIKQGEYWNVKFEENYYLRPEEHFTSLLKDSVEKRLMSDVPLGAFISGGIDSAAVLSQMGSNVKTFSIGFNEDNTNTLRDSRIVAERFNADHHELVADSSILRLLPRVAYHLDEPIIEPSVLPGFKLAEFAKKYVTVVLTGEGADEILYGYPHYKIFSMANKVNKLSFAMLRRDSLSKMEELIPEGIYNKLFHYPYPIGKEGKSRIKNLLRSGDDTSRFYIELMSIFPKNNQICRFNTPEPLNATINYFNSKNSMHDIALFELKNWLPNHVLTRLDKITMAHALEARVPFLDHRLVEYCATLPNSLKLNGFDEKFILKKAMSRIIPKNILNKRKSPFFTPFAEWFESDIKQISDSVIAEDIIKRYFDTSKLQDIIDNHNKSKLLCSRQLWAIISFYVWHRLFIDAESVNSINLN